MANFIVPEKIQDLVASRNQTWASADAASGVATQLESFSKDASLAAAPAPIPAALSDGTPPAELSAALQNVAEELKVIASHNKKLGSTHALIREINAQVAEELRRKKTMRLILICVAVGMAVIAVVVFVMLVIWLVKR